MMGGQTTPASELPAVASEMARPRCLSNHSEASATNGAKLAALPRPIVTPETTAKTAGSCAKAVSDVAEAHQDRAAGQRRQDAEPVRKPADNDAADHEADDGRARRAAQRPRAAR